MTSQYGTWLNQLLPLGDLGCVQEACVAPDEHMFLVAPTADNDFYALIRLPWTLEEWLWRWVRGEQFTA